MWYEADKAMPCAQHNGSHNVTDDGWFSTGDMACIDQHGHVQLTDRTKDVIKSGGEWISSINLENVAVGHPQVPACYVKEAVPLSALNDAFATEVCAPSWLA